MASVFAASAQAVRRRHREIGGLAHHHDKVAAGETPEGDDPLDVIDRRDADPDAAIGPRQNCLVHRRVADRERRMHRGGPGQRLHAAAMGIDQRRQATASQPGRGEHVGQCVGTVGSANQPAGRLRQREDKGTSGTGGSPRRRPVRPPACWRRGPPRRRASTAPASRWRNWHRPSRCLCPTAAGTMSWMMTWRWSAMNRSSATAVSPGILARQSSSLNVSGLASHAVCRTRERLVDHQQLLLRLHGEGGGLGGDRRLHPCARGRRLAPGWRGRC